LLRVQPPALAIEYVPLSALAPMPGNPRRNEAAIGPVAASIKRFGWTNPILARRDDRVVVAGHTRLEAAKQLGLDKVPVIWLDLDPVSSRLYNLADNKLASISEWDQGPLAEMLRELSAEDVAGLAIAGFGAEDIAAILAKAEGQAQGKTDADEVPEVPKDSYVQPGDLYELGTHRLLCGDSTKPEEVGSLMAGEAADICWTDPPWNVAYGERNNPAAGWSKRKDRVIANDNLGEAFPGFCAAFCGEIARVLKPGALLYMAMSAQEWPTIDGALRTAGFHWSSSIIWAKDSLVLSRKDYHTQYEPIWYGWREGAARLQEVKDRKQSDVWQIDRPKRSDEHPTMKPVELVARALENSSPLGGLVFEPFSGSGTTIIAAERTRRRCYAIELEPRYVQVAIERWEAFTGRKATKAGEPVALPAKPKAKAKPKKRRAA
jgi:DNA modification methylase